ncbi:MAG TPA: hypothetical protein VK179_13825 [Bacteroidales bacterium]|nr:hypothetical protein [Bacteroidales bacterium]
MGNKGISVGVEIKGNAKGFKSAAEDAKRASEAMKQKAQESSRGMSSSFDKVVKSAGAIGLAVAGVSSAVELVKKGISATQFTADAYDKIMTKAKFSTDQFFIAVSSGDMGNLIDQLRRAADEGGRYAEVVDWLGDATQAVKIRAHEAAPELARLEAIFRDTSGETSWKDRQKALDDYKILYKKTLDDQLNLDNRNFENEIRNATVKSGLQKEDILFVLKNYDLLEAEQEKAAENLQKYNNLLNAQTTVSQGMYSYTVKDAKAKEKALEFYKSLSSEEQRWLNIQKNYGKLNDENLAKLAEANNQLFDTKTAINNIEVETIRVQSSIIKQSKKRLETEQAVTKEVEKQVEITTKAASKPTLPAYSGSSLHTGQLSTPDLDGMTAVNIKLDERAALFKKIENSQIAVNTLVQSEADIFGSINNLLDANMNKEIKNAKNSEEKQEAIRRQHFFSEQRLAIAQANIMGGLASLRVWSGQGSVYEKIAQQIYVAAQTATQIALIKSQKFAKGGVVSGPTLATVGEYANAKTDPEVIAPLSKLKSLLGNTSGGEVVFRIEGNDLVGVLNRANRKSKSFA